MYNNTGKGGLFFDNLYEWLWATEAREEPATKEEFLKAGLSAEDFSDYIAFVKRLYGEYFVASNMVAAKYDPPFSKLSGLWTEFTNFCIDRKLILKFADSNGNRMPVSSPFELEHFTFIHHYPELPDAYHVCTLDEFRLAIEMVLAYKDDDCYMQMMYDTTISTEETYDMLTRYNISQRKSLPLTKQEVEELIATIEADLRKIEDRIEQHNASTPRPIGAVETRHDYLEILKAQEAWIQKRTALDREYSRVSYCYDSVAMIVEDGTHDNIFSHFPDDTLYIHKGQIVCQKHHHRIEQATAVLTDKNGKDIELNVNHCLDCNKFFLDYNIYLRYRERYGTILGNIRMIKNGDFTDDGYDLADESPLRLCGYSVSQKAALSQAERQTIIESCIKNGAMTKEGVIRLLNWFIEVNGAKKGNELAFQKWCRDLDFVLAYNTPRQNKYRITKVERYNRNRFYINSTSTLAKPQGETAPVVSPFVGMRVVHSKDMFGSGTVTAILDETIEIAFDNGRTLKFLRNSFASGYLTPYNECSTGDNSVRLLQE